MAITRPDSDTRARKICTYDLEWIPGDMTLRLAGLFDGETYISFTSIPEFLAHLLTRRYSRHWIYAHAGGLADAQFLLEELMKRPEYKVEALFSGSSAIVIAISKGSDKWVLVDSYWLLRDSLAKIGEKIGMLKGGADYFCPDHPACGHTSDPKPTCVFYSPIAVLRDYNRLDCEILHAAIIRFERTIQDLGGQLELTIASCGLSLFRRAFLKRDIPTNPIVNAYASRAYAASRVEPFQTECGPANYYDINSSFPYSMTFPAPGRMIGCSKKLPTSDGAIYMADAEIEIPDCYLPPMPYRHKNRVFFPTGSWRTWFMSADLELIESSGARIRHIHETCEFEPISDLSQYVHTLYELRKKSDGFENAVYKYLLNCLYGKFAEKDEKTSLILHPLDTDCPHVPPHTLSPDAPPGTLPACWELLFPGAYLFTASTPVPHAHTAISAHVTALSRRWIYERLHDAHEAQGAQIYYCDTDSIITTGTFPTSTELGALKLEKTISAGVFLGPKLYRIDQEAKAKGFSRMNPEKFDALERGEQVASLRMSRVKENFRAGNLVPREGVYKKQLRNKLQPKRRILPSGDSRPWAITELK